VIEVASTSEGAGGGTIPGGASLPFSLMWFTVNQLDSAAEHGPGDAEVGRLSDRIEPEEETMDVP